MMFVLLLFVTVSLCSGQTIRDNFDFNVRLTCAKTPYFNSTISIEEIDSNKVDTIAKSMPGLSIGGVRRHRVKVTLLGDELFSKVYNFQITIQHNCNNPSGVTKVVQFQNGIPIQKMFYDVSLDLDLMNLSRVVVPIVRIFN